MEKNVNNKTLIIAVVGLTIPLLQGCPKKFNINGVELTSEDLCNHKSSCLPGNRAPIGFEYKDFYFDDHAYRPELNLSFLNSSESQKVGEENVDRPPVTYNLTEIKEAASSVLGKITTDNTGGIPRVCDTYKGPTYFSWSELNDPFTKEDYSVYNINYINFKKTVKNIIDIDAELDIQLKKIDKLGLSDEEESDLKAAVKAGFDRTNDIDVGFNASYIEVGLSQEVVEKMFYGQDDKYKVCLEMITGTSSKDEEKNSTGQTNNNQKSKIKFISGVGLVWVTSMNVTNDMVQNAFAELKADTEKDDSLASAKVKLKAEISQAVTTNIKNSFVDSYKIVSMNKYYYKEK